MIQLEQATSGSTCFGCKQHVDAGGMLSHFVNCSGKPLTRRHDCPAQGEKSFMIRVATDHQFWLYAEARGSTRLENLYMFLRGHWYECCGYINPFMINGCEVSKEDMQKSISDIFSAGDTFRYSNNSDMPTSVSGVITGVHFREAERRAMLAPENESGEEYCEICLTEMN
jgi:hypothetical protein